MKLNPVVPILFLALVTFLGGCRSRPLELYRPGDREVWQTVALPPAPAATTPSQTMTQPTTENRPVVVMSTTMGDITIELFAAESPITTENFLQYVDSGHYSGTIFHRVIPNFMIQGGGFTENMVDRPTRDPIRNEAGNRISNRRGTIAMARTNVIDSATAQFFINVVDNTALNGDGIRSGYAVFGRVIEGMEVVDRIVAVETTSRGPHDDVPVTPVVIREVRRQS
jgi:peptidyl-prolyl cis-trans isomerase A (cyclophilin A)